MSARALLITPVMPSATGNGLSMRAGMWLSALAGRFDVDVAVASLFAPHDSAPTFTASLAHSVHMLSGTLAQAPGVPRPVPTLDERSDEVLRDLMARADVIVVFRLYLAGFTASHPDVPVVLDLDDLDWVREERLGDMVEAQAYRAYAAAMLPRATVATTACDADDTSAIESGHTWMHVPNGVRSPLQHDDDATPPDIDLLFVATLGYWPNVHAATWLVHEVVPRLPGVTVAIVGAAPAPEVLALAGPAVTVAADVPDVTPWYRRARVCVVPIHAGSGTRTKIPEAWAHGRPVVTTTIGAEGLDVSGAALIADDPDAFAAACTQVLADAHLADRLVRAGHAHYESAHTIDRAIECADAAIDTAMARLGRTPPAHRVRP